MKFLRRWRFYKHTNKKSAIVDVEAKVFKPDGNDLVNTVTKIFEPSQAEKKEKNSCGEKYCINKDDKSELIREINIRLAGFGGNVPTDVFTDQTEKMIKQFQRDYMKVPETGKVCGNVLRAIDEFQAKYPVAFNQTKCRCGSCTGYGNGKFIEQKGKVSILEKSRKYEYPGIHRTLIWMLRSTQFYLATHEKDLKLKVAKVHSGYRCNIDNSQHLNLQGLPRSSTNHMGKALDIHIYKNNDSLTTVSNCDKVRDLMKKYSGVNYRWSGKNYIALEPSPRNRIGTEFVAENWVHFDVRTFDLIYLEDKYFVKNISACNGKSIVQLAKDLGFINTCICINPSKSELSNKNETTKQSDRVDPKMLKTSKKGIDFIKGWEGKHMSGEKHIPYNDSKNFCTIGYGHLIAKNKCNNITMPEEFKNGITEDEALKYFNDRLIGFEKAIQRDIKVNLYQYEFDALVSLVFNTGGEFLNTGGANDGETQIKKKINNE